MAHQADHGTRSTLTGMLLIGLLWTGLGTAAVLEWGLVRGVVVAVWGVSVPAIVVMIGLAARPSRRPPSAGAGASPQGSVRVAA